MSEPRTATGRRIDAAFRAAYERGDRSASWEDARSWILAIEAEARQPDSEALRLLRELVEVYGGNYEPEGRLIDMSAVAEKARVLLAALPPSDPPALDVLAGRLFGLYGDHVPGALRHDWEADAARLSAQPEDQPAEDADD